MSVDLQVLADPARSCSAMLVGALLAGGHVVLTGGSTPGAAYEETARALRGTQGDAGRATIWFSDERCVGPEDELSNYGLLKRTLLEPIGEAGAPEVRRIEGEQGPHEAALRYERELRECDALPFDFVLLGMGPDGHLASMFPSQPSLSERSRLAVGVEEAGLEPYVPRVTLTLPALAISEQIVFLVTGESKAAAVASVFGPQASPELERPASLLVPLARKVTVLLDPAAASGL